MKFPDDYINCVITGDCIEILKQIPDKSIDAIITDPPWPGCTPGIPGEDRPIELLNEFCKEVPRITNRLILHLGLMTDPRILTAVPDSMPFVQVCWLRYIPPRYYGPILYEADVAYVFGHKQLPPGRRVFGASCQKSSNIYKRNPEQIKSGHPAYRSLEHVSWLVQSFSRPDDIILDPFGGTGTTALAARLAGRRFIHIDILEQFNISARRMIFEKDLFNREN